MVRYGTFQLRFERLNELELPNYTPAEEVRIHPIPSATNCLELVYELMVRYVQLEVREPGLGILLACKADFASSESPIFKHLTDRTDFLLKMAEKYPENFDPVPRRDYPDNPPDSNQMIQRRVWGILSRFAAVPA